MGDWHNLGNHVRREIIGAIMKSPPVLSMIAAQLEGKGETIDNNTRIEIKIDSIRVRVTSGEDGESAESGS